MHHALLYPACCVTLPVMHTVTLSDIHHLLPPCLQHGPAPHPMGGPAAGPMVHLQVVLWPLVMGSRSSSSRSRVIKRASGSRCTQLQATMFKAMAGSPAWSRGLVGSLLDLGAPDTPAEVCVCGVQHGMFALLWHLCTAGVGFQEAPLPVASRSRVQSVSCWLGHAWVRQQDGAARVPCRASILEVCFAAGMWTFRLLTGPPWAIL